MQALSSVIQINASTIWRKTKEIKGKEKENLNIAVVAILIDGEANTPEVKKLI